jgi:hypothetical protein
VFVNARYSFEFINLLIRQMGSKSQDIFGFQIDLRMSTVDEYLEQIQSMKYKFKTYKGDFLPLIDDPYI